MMNFRQQCKDYGYKEIVEFLQQKVTKEEAIEKIKQESRRYAKRQLTWFRKYKNDVIWLDNNESVEKNIEKITKNC